MHFLSTQRSQWRAALSVCACAAAFFSGGQAWASDGTITINGKVLNNTCAIAAVAGTVAPSSGSSSLTLTLPSISYASIANHGSATGSTPFTIGVYNCGATGLTMSVGFDVNGGMNNSGVLTNTGTSNQSVIAFRIMNSDNATPVTTSTPNVAAAGISSSGAGGTGGGSQTFYVQYYNYSAGTTVTSGMAGTVVGSVTYTIIYT